MSAALARSRPPSEELISLMRQAAQLRVCGKTWETIGKELGRSAERCRHWPQEFEVLWKKLYLEAEDEQLTELATLARAVQKNFMTCQELPLRQNAANAFLKLRERVRIDTAKALKGGEDSAAHLEFAAFPDTLNPEEMKKMLFELFQRCHEATQPNEGRAGDVSPLISPSASESPLLSPSGG